MNELVVERWESSFLKQGRGWLLVYGRRKVGKTFLLRSFLSWNLYVLVSRGGLCFVNGGLVEVDEAIERVVEVLRDGGLVVIDEFQRLPEHFLDRLSHVHPSGRLILSGSSLNVVGRVLDRRSPMLGLLMPFKLDLISPADIIISLIKFGLDFRSAVLWGVLIRDPWLIPFINLSSPPWVEISRLASMLTASASGLIGEVFLEEERQLTRLYDAVLRLLADGYWSSKIITAELYDMGLISAPNPGIVTGILSKLENMGLVEKIPLWRSRGARFYYHHRSALISTLLWMDERFEFEDYPPHRVEDALRSHLALEIQFFIGELLAKSRGFKRAYTVLPRGLGDVDIVLLDRKGRAIEGFEVKTGSISRSEIQNSIDKIRDLGIPRVGVISLTEKPPEIQGVDESLGPSELLKAVKTLRKIEWSR